MYYSFEISHATLNEWKEESYAFALIDVREKEEREQGHMGGESIPLSELIERVDELPKKTPIVFYCRSGARSLLAARKLRDVLGRDDIYTLGGGILALQKQPS